MEGCRGGACALAAAAVPLLLGVPKRRPPGTNDGALARKGVDPAASLARLGAELRTPEEATLRAAEGALLSSGLCDGAGGV